MKEIVYDWGGANVWLFHLINDVRAGWLDQFMLAGSVIGEHANFVPILGLLTLVATYTVTYTYARHPANGEETAQLWLGVIAVFALSCGLDGALVSWLKPALDFPRPLFALGDAGVHVIGEVKLHHSFPSGHASFAMLVCASLWPLGRWWRVGGVFFLLWVGLSRVSLGVHFPADVLGGFMISFLVVLAVRFALHMLALAAVRMGETRFDV